MKKIIQSAFVAALLFGAGAAQAQISQLSAGHILVGGSGGYSSDSPADTSQFEITKITNGNFSPRVGYFIKDNLVVGLDIHYSVIRNKVKYLKVNGVGFEVTETTVNTETLIGPFARYYKPVGEKSAFFGHLSLGFGGSKEKVEYEGADKPSNENIPKDIKYGRVNVSLQPGFAFFPTKSLGLELTTTAIGLGYNRSRFNDPRPDKDPLKDEDYTESGFSAQADLRNLINPGSWRIGATFFFGGGE